MTKEDKIIKIEEVERQADVNFRIISEVFIEGIEGTSGKKPYTNIQSSAPRLLENIAEEINLREFKIKRINDKYAKEALKNDE